MMKQSILSFLLMLPVAIFSQESKNSVSVYPSHNAQVDPVLLNNNVALYAQGVTSLQMNSGSASTLGTVPSRVRLGLAIDGPHSLSMRIRMAAASGGHQLGTNGQMVPINEIGVDRSINDTVNTTSDKTLSTNNNLRDAAMIDEALLFYGINKDLDLIIGVADLRTFDRTGRGFTDNPVVLDETGGFFSTHFLRQNAFLSLEQQHFRSIGALLVSYDITKWLNLRAGLTAGKASFHVTIRNTGILELTSTQSIIPGKLTHLQVGVGAVDADESTVHRLAANGHASLSQEVFDSFYVFAGYSIVGDPVVAQFFGPAHYHYKGGLAMAFNGRDPAKAKYFAGIGFSQVKAYAFAEKETYSELFFRINLNENVNITPQFGYMLNANGSSDTIMLLGIRMNARI